MAGYSRAVFKLAYVNNLIYQENSNCNWWKWSRNSWVATTNPLPTDTCGAADISGGYAGLGGYLLPDGYLKTAGNQITSLDGKPVRLACVGYFQFVNILQDVAGMVADGFNCARLEWRNATSQSDLVAEAGPKGLKIILDHHEDERGTPCDGWSQQKNGLWLDSGPGTDGTNGCGITGTVSAAVFQNDWVTVAQRYANNPTVIGFDLDNEPVVSINNITWGGGSAVDIHKMFQDVGNAILAVNPGALIIAEGPINYGGCYIGAGVCPEGDLTMVQSLPVVLNVPNKVVYSVHEYPQEIGSINPDSGSAAVSRMNNVWGYLVSQNIAPVWIGEMGANMQSADAIAWAATMVSYFNGRAQGGPMFSGSEQPISTDWWGWGDLTGEVPDGTLSGSTPRHEVQAITKQLMFSPAGVCK
jgi:endoglucanase